MLGLMSSCATDRSAGEWLAAAGQAATSGQARPENPQTLVAKRFHSATCDIPPARAWSQNAGSTAVAAGSFAADSVRM